MSVIYLHIKFLGILFSRNMGTLSCLMAVILLHVRIIIPSYLCIFFWLSLCFHTKLLPLSTYYQGVIIVIRWNIVHWMISINFKYNFVILM
jgi:hypothetical protein